VKIAYSGGLGTYDILLADRVLFTGAAIERLIRAPKATMPEAATVTATETAEEAPKKAPKKAPAKSPRDEEVTE
jgi:hypothetical protein